MNISQARNIKAQCKTAVEGLMANAKRENRGFNGQEQAEFDRNMAVAREANEMIERAAADADITQQIRALSGDMTPTAPGTYRAGGGGSLGSQFVASEAWGWLEGTRYSRPAGQWSTPSVELYESGLQAATLTEDAARGGDLVVPTYRPGIIQLPTRRLTVAGLLASGSTDSNAVIYMKETTFTNAAAAVAKAGTKPESTLIFDAVTDPVKKLAHWIPVTEEILLDVSQMRTYIDSRMRDGVDLA